MNRLRTFLSLERLENRETPSPIGPQPTDPNAPPTDVPPGQEAPPSDNGVPTDPNYWF